MIPANPNIPPINGGDATSGAQSQGGTIGSENVARFADVKFGNRGSGDADVSGGEISPWAYAGGAVALLAIIWLIKR